MTACTKEPRATVGHEIFHDPGPATIDYDTGKKETAGVLDVEIRRPAAEGVLVLTLNVVECSTLSIRAAQN